MYEDWQVEAAVFPPKGHVFCIASAGETSMALSARGDSVTAVDINPAQVEYVRQRLAGGPLRQGTADRLFAFGRRLLPLLGLRGRAIRAFMELDDTSTQLEFWRRRLVTARFRFFLKAVINRVVLRIVYHPAFLQVLPPHFDRVMVARLERCFARHLNRSNPYAWRLFLGVDPPDPPPPKPPGDRIELVEADAAAYLESCAPRSFSGFSLSNILDGTTAAYRERLMDAVRRSAAPGAVVVLRSFGEPAPGESTQWAARDRSILWGIVSVEQL
jgi:S-adenosylmethionine:diacylglycerol 3-amino-3-carboxypropyl transferase